MLFFLDRLVIAYFEACRTGIETIKKSAFLHVGFHKTGTTSIQSLLEMNRTLLPLDTVFLGQTDAPLKRLRSYCKSFDRAPSDERGQTVISEIQRIVSHPSISGAQRLIISSEDLIGRIPSNRNSEAVYKNSGDVLRWLVDGLPDYEICIVLYKRDRNSWLNSLYRHLLRTRGIRLKKEDFVQLDKFASFDFKCIIDQIMEKTKCRVAQLDFEDDLSNRLGPGSQFLSIAGITDADTSDWKEVGKINEGLSEELERKMSSRHMLLLPPRLRRFYLKRKNR